MQNKAVITSLQSPSLPVYKHRYVNGSSVSYGGEKALKKQLPSKSDHVTHTLYTSTGTKRVFYSTYFTKLKEFVFLSNTLKEELRNMQMKSQQVLQKREEECKNALKQIQVRTTYGHSISMLY